MPMSLPSALGPACVGLRVVVRRLLPGQRGPSGGPAMTDLLGVMEAWDQTTTSIRDEDGTLVVVERALIVSGKAVPPRPSVRLRVSAADAELRALDSWPAVESARLGGWVLRASGGFSARANSALLVGDPGLPWAEAVAAVRDWYAARGLPAWVQALAGSAERDRLGADGWVTARPGEADTGMLVAGLARARRHNRALLPSGGDHTVAVAAELDESWLADDARARTHRTQAEAVLGGPEQVGFVSVTDSAGRLVAKGRAALSVRADVWVGITDVWVSPEDRRRGLGGIVLDALLGWGAERGATTAYLQSRLDNAGALALYERVGFVVHHAYGYLRAGDEPPG